jgi:hypothetical protein
MVETNWTKLAAPHAVIETSLRNSSQERNFLLQRPGGETGAFGSIAGAETALTREFGRHVFEIAALLQSVSGGRTRVRTWDPMIKRHLFLCFWQTGMAAAVGC